MMSWDGVLWRWRPKWRVQRQAELMKNELFIFGQVYSVQKENEHLLKPKAREHTGAREY